MCYLIVWTRIDELGMIKCINHDWLIGWILA